MYQSLETHLAKHLEMGDLGTQHLQEPLEGKDLKRAPSLSVLLSALEVDATQAFPGHTGSGATRSNADFTGRTLTLLRSPKSWPTSRSHSLGGIQV